MTTSSVLGKTGEEFAARYLNNLGYELIETNWRCPSGEIDLVMSHDEDIVFVEVKTRSSTQFGDPLNAVDFRKLYRLRKLARIWLSENGISSSWRIDLVGLIRVHNEDFDVQHLVGI